MGWRLVVAASVIVLLTLVSCGARTDDDPDRHNGLTPIAISDATATIPSTVEVTQPAVTAEESDVASRIASAVEATQIAATVEAAVEATVTAAALSSESRRGAFIRALEFLPDNPEIRAGVLVNDYQSARELFGIDSPPLDPTDNQILEYVNRLIGPGTTGLSTNSTIDGFGRRRDDVAGWRSALGFTAADVNLSVVAGSDPKIYEILTGKFVWPLIYLAIMNDQVWSPELEETSHNGFEFFSWGEDYRPNLRMSDDAVRTLGRGHRLLVIDEILFWTLGSPEMRSLIDASSGKESALALNDDFRVLANTMDAESAYAGLLTNETPSLAAGAGLAEGGYGLSDMAYDQALRTLGPIAVGRYDAYGIGASFDGQDNILTIALLYSDEASALNNLNAVEKMVAYQLDVGESLLGRVSWSEVLGVPKLPTESHVNIRLDGRVVVVNIKTSRATTWATMTTEYDHLIFHR